MTPWFVVRCKAKREVVVARNLENLNIQVYCPKTRSDSVVKKSGIEMMFPGYLFISKESSFDKLQKVKYAVGVIEVVSFSESPAELDNKKMDEIIAVERFLWESPVFQEKKFNAGDSISIEIGGVFLNGDFVRYSSADRAIVLLNILSSSHLSDICLKDIKLRQSG